MPLPAQHDTKLWLALLHEIDVRGGSAKPTDLYPELRQYFPAITDEDLAESLPTGPTTGQTGSGGRASISSTGGASTPAPVS